MKLKHLLLTLTSALVLTGCIPASFKPGKATPSPTPTPQVESTGDIDQDLQQIDQELNALDQETDLSDLTEADLGL